MPIGVLIDIPRCTAEQYDRVAADVGLAPPDPTPPPGLVSHVAGPVSGGWRVFDIWESREHHDQFVTQHLRPALEAAKVPPFRPEIMDLHNVVR